MVLTRALVVMLLAAGCGQSLFDANGKHDAGGDDGGPDAAPVTACPTPCLGDAAADFDGTPNGTANRWRFVDDLRNRTWAAMTPADGGLVGADAANAITSCANEPGAAACAALPGALLVSSAGNASAADPAIGYPVSAAAVIQLSVSVHIPEGVAAQPVRVYRNSREDVLFTATATPGMTLGRTLEVEALPGDRFFLAIAPTGSGAAKIGVQFFVSETTVSFPGKCQLAVSFSAAAGNNVDNLCGADLEYQLYDPNGSDPTASVPPSLGAGPFPELGGGADIVPNYFYRGNTVLLKPAETTVQLWVKADVVDSIYTGWPYSDLDLGDTTPGGLGIGIFQGGGGLSWIATVCTKGTAPLEFAEQSVTYPSDGAWHFLRVVHAGGMVKMCMDGRLVGMFPLADGKTISTIAPRVGRNSIWNPIGSYFDGGIDDVRVLSTALPCE